MNKSIRPIAIGIIINDGRLFVLEGRDSVKGETFYRPLGGSIEFGEKGEKALAREFKEEINADLIDIKYLATLENIFTYQGENHHEIVLVYACDFAGKSFYRKKDLTGREDDGSEFKCHWRPLKDLDSQTTPLYPEGLLEFLKRTYFK